MLPRISRNPAINILNTDFKPHAGFSSFTVLLHSDSPLKDQLQDITDAENYVICSQNCDSYLTSFLSPSSQIIYCPDDNILSLPLAPLRSHSGPGPGKYELYCTIMWMDHFINCSEKVKVRLRIENY